LERLAEFAGRWEASYPAIVKMWESAWAEFVPFLSFAPDVRASDHVGIAVRGGCGSGDTLGSNRSYR